MVVNFSCAPVTAAALVVSKVVKVATPALVATAVVPVRDQMPVSFLAAVIVFAVLFVHVLP